MVLPNSVASLRCSLTSLVIKCCRNIFLDSFFPEKENIFLVFFHKGFYYIALIVLELTGQTKLAFNSVCLCLTSAGIKSLPASYLLFNFLWLQQFLTVIQAHLKFVPCPRIAFNISLYYAQLQVYFQGTKQRIFNSILL